MSKNECTVELSQIVGYETGLLDAAQRQELDAHFHFGCPACKEQLATIRGLATEIELTRPPMLAQPLLDTQFLQPVGVRGGATLTRRRVYEAESKVCIDIDQRETGPGTSTVEGQVLIKGGDLDDLDGITVTLCQDSVPVVVGTVDMLGDFTIEDVSSGNYDLTMTVGNLGVAIRGIEI